MEVTKRTVYVSQDFLDKLEEYLSADERFTSPEMAGLILYTYHHKELEFKVK